MILFQIRQYFRFEAFRVQRDFLEFMIFPKDFEVIFKIC